MDLSNLATLINHSGETKHAIEKTLKLPQGSISRWQSGEFKPGTEALIKLADHFGVPIDHIIGRDVPDFTPPPDHQFIIGNYAGFTDVEKALVRGYITAVKELRTAT